MPIQRPLRLRRSATLAVAALLLAFACPSALAQKAPATPVQSGARQKLDGLIASVLAKQAARSKSTASALRAIAEDLAAPAEAATAKAHVDIATARIDLEAAQKDVDAAVRAKRFQDAATAHRAALSAAMAATKALLGPPLAKLPAAGSATVSLPSGGWTELGARPSAPNKPFTYESVLATPSTSGLVVRWRQDLSQLGVYVESSYTGDTPRAAFVQSFTVPAGVRTVDVTATVRVSGYAKITALAVGWAWAELHALLAATGPDGQCYADRALWEHRGAVADIVSEAISQDAQLVCRIVRGDPSVASTYLLSAGVSEAVGAGGIAAAVLDTDGTGALSEAGYPYRVAVDSMKWRVAD